MTEVQKTGKKIKKLIKPTKKLIKQATNNNAEVTLNTDKKLTKRDKIILSGLQKSANMRKTSTATDWTNSQHHQFYSYSFATDYLEVPESYCEKIRFFREVYLDDPIVASAIDIHVDLPLSKIILGLPPGKDHQNNEKILDFYQKMLDRLNILQILVEASHDYWLLGEAAIFAEYDEDEKIWSKLVVIPPESLDVKSIPFSHENKIELIVSDEIQDAIKSPHDHEKKKIVEDIPNDVKQCIVKGTNLPLDTDPYSGSHVYRLIRKRDPNNPRGSSILNRLLKTLVYRDKLRQAQTQRASRNMTPTRLIWGEDLSNEQLDQLREQVDLSLVDPDYSIITNFEVHWEEMGNNDRLLDISTELELTDQHLMAGLGVTKELLMGEGSYTGSRIGLEVMSNRYFLFRNNVERYIEESLFKPVAIANGFVEQDQFGNEKLLYPKFRFERLSIKDSETLFDQVMNLYLKGSVPFTTVAQLLNLDSEDATTKVESDFSSFKDPNFNEIIQNAYSEIGRMIAEKTNLFEKVAKQMKLNVKEAPAEEDDFGGRF